MNSFFHEPFSLAPKVVQPDVSESFGCSADPLEVEFPFCVVKSFPQSNDHVIVWSKAKVENLLRSKPEKFNQFWMEYGNSLDEVAEGVEKNTRVLRLPIRARPVRLKE